MHTICVFSTKGCLVIHIAFFYGDQVYFWYRKSELPFKFINRLIARV
jgi:hypothetical protein